MLRVALAYGQQKGSGEVPLCKACTDVNRSADRNCSEPRLMGWTLYSASMLERSVAVSPFFVDRFVVCVPSLSSINAVCPPLPGGPSLSILRGVAT